MRRKRIAAVLNSVRTYPIKFSDHPNLVSVKMVGGWTHKKRLIDGRWYVPIAFIPREGTATCSICHKKRQLMTIHCEHCDAPLNGIDGKQRVSDEALEKAASDFVESRLYKLSKEVVEMDFTKRATPINQPRQPRGSSGEAFERRNFLKAMDLPSGPRGKDGKPILVKIEGFRDAPENMPYSQYLIDVRIGKVPYVIGIKDESDTKLNNIISTLGPKTDRWTGKSIKMYAGWWEREQKHVVRIVGKGKKS